MPACFEQVESYLLDVVNVASDSTHSSATSIFEQVIADLKLSASYIEKANTKIERVLECAL